MDQGNHGSHHQSKASRLQLKAQLSGGGCLSAAEMAGRVVIDLPGRTPTPEQRRRVYARKTYRFFEGGEVTRTDILRLLERRVPDGRARGLKSLRLTELGEILRYFGQYHSPERLLPKYGYASPGALYATQMYLEVAHVAGLAPGYYYYHPVHHQLVRTLEGPDTGRPRLRVHFVGKTAAIKPVYQTNLQEVLAIEAGHMAGLFDQVLPGYGMAIEAAEASPAAGSLHQWADGDLHLAAFEVVPHGPAPIPDDTAPDNTAPDDLEIYVQAHPGRVADLPAGQYAYQAGELARVSGERILRKHVIAINQRVYDRASFGITLVAAGSEDWMSYVALGRTLQALMMNEENLGFMSAGYSSRTGRPLPAAKRMNGILTQSGRDTGPSYFFLGGRVSDEQRRSEGMKEDSVHMQGPAEMLKEELATLLPPYMVPNRVVVLDKLPLTPNGKVDTATLSASAEASAEIANRRVVAPRTPVENGISALWRSVTRHDTVSVQDNFFEIGGNSLMAVALVNKINRTFGSSLPLQVLFEHPTVEQLAALIDSEQSKDCSRLVQLRGGSQRPIICWPGLGGYPMNLRLLAERAESGRPVYGMQAHGINPGERPHETIEEMAAGDVKAIRCLQPEGPYSLWGYSFGARVAFETAYQLEQAGDQVDHLFLIAPGSPKVRARDKLAYRSDTAYLTILFSVFAGSITGPALDECLSVARDEESLAAFVARRYPNLDVKLVKRIVEIVRLTYGFKYEFRELNERQINAPITIFKARGDDCSFIEGSRASFAKAPRVIQLDADHYGLLKETGVGELVKKIRYRLLMERVPALETASGRAS
jgi:thioesterase domain-containing protein/acyl carrier protein